MSIEIENEYNKGFKNGYYSSLNLMQSYFDGVVKIALTDMLDKAYSGIKDVHDDFLNGIEKEATRRKRGL